MESAARNRISAVASPTNSASLVNLVQGDAFADAVSGVPVELLGLESDALEQRFRPTRTDWALKCAFWNEIRNSPGSPGSIKPSRIFGGICSEQHWYGHFLKDKARVAWILSPARNYEQELESLLPLVAAKAHEILTIDYRDDRGRPVPGLLKLVLQAAKLVEDRVLGAAVERVESKSVSVQMRAQEVPIGTSMEELDREIARLEGKVVAIEVQAK